MYRFYVHDDARGDLDGLWETDPVAAARVAVVLEQLEHDESLRERLLEHRYGSNRTADFEIQKWVSQWEKNRDLWRLKIWALEDLDIRYRVIYAYSIPNRSFHVLAVAHRDFNYDESDRISQRVLRAYQDL